MNGFGKSAKFVEVDWVYCLSRASQQTAHRFDEVMETIEDFAEKYLEYWFTVDFDTDRNINDMHELFGATCCLAELQRTLRGKLYSEKPLRLVLDRRPFI